MRTGARDWGLGQFWILDFGFWIDPAYCLPMLTFVKGFEPRVCLPWERQATAAAVRAQPGVARPGELGSAMRQPPYRDS